MLSNFLFLTGHVFSILPPGNIQEENGEMPEQLVGRLQDGECSLDVPPPIGNKTTCPKLRNYSPEVVELPILYKVTFSTSSVLMKLFATTSPEDEHIASSSSRFAFSGNTADAFANTILFAQALPYQPCFHITASHLNPKAACSRIYTSQFTEELLPYVIRVAIMWRLPMDDEQFAP